MKAATLPPLRSAPANNKLPLTNYQLPMPDEDPSDTEEEPEANAAQPSALSNALALLDRLDAASPPRPPTVLSVFRLYCVRQMTIAEVARSCRCSVGTVCNRLNL